jgi:hypothetical protein
MLGAECRCTFWREQRPTHIFPLARRPSFTRGGTDQCNYGWFIWDRGGCVLGSHWLQVLSEQAPAPVRWPICTVCGAALTARRGAKTCGPKCRQKAYRQRVTDSVTDKPPSHLLLDNPSSPKWITPAWEVFQRPYRKGASGGEETVPGIGGADPESSRQG